MHSISELLPQEPPMRFLEELSTCSESGATARARFGADDFAVHDGYVLEAVLVECAAQTAAAAMAQRALAGGGKKPGADGMLVAVSHFNFERRVSAGKVIEISIQEERRMGLMLLISTRITCEGEGVVTGELMVYA